jgi:hypothetical protein
MLSSINNNKDFTTLADIYHQVRTIPDGDGEKFGCTVDEILKRNTLTGCTDYGLVFAALCRAKGIPTVFLQTARIDWIKDLREQNNNSGMIRGHILVEVYIDNQWYLIDSTAGKLYLKYDRNNFSLDDGYYVFAKSLEVFDMGTKVEMDNSNRMKDIFKDFDMALYNQPFYTYINLTNLNETHISATFLGEQSQNSDDSFEYVIVGTKEETEALVTKFGLSHWQGYSESSFVMNYDNIKFNNFIYFRIKGTPVPKQIRDMVPEIGSINDSVYRKPYGSRYIIVISGSSKSDAFNIINSMDKL